MTQHTFQAASQARSAVLAQLDTDALTLEVPFERSYIEAWECAAPAGGMSLPQLLSTTQVALFLAADPAPWATAFCAALTCGHADLLIAQDLLRALGANEQWAVLQFHIYLQRPARADLAATLAAVPSALHAHAVAAHMHTQALLAFETPTTFEEDADGLASGLSLTVAAAQLPHPSALHMPEASTVAGAGTIQLNELPALLSACHAGNQHLQSVHLNICCTATPQARRKALEAAFEEGSATNVSTGALTTAMGQLSRMGVQHLSLRLSEYDEWWSQVHMPSALRCLVRFTALSTLLLDGIGGFEHPWVPHLARAVKQMPALRCFALEHCSCIPSDEAARVLRACAPLQQLSLRSSAINYDNTELEYDEYDQPHSSQQARGAEQLLLAIKAHSALQALDIVPYPGLNEGAHDHLGEFDEYMYEPFHDHISSFQILSIMRACSGLRRLALPHAEGFGWEAPQMLRLTHLELTASFQKHFLHCAPSLRTLQVGDVTWQDLQSDTFACCSHLQQLELCARASRTPRAITATIALPATLTALQLHCRDGHGGVTQADEHPVAALLRGLTVCAALRSLDISGDMDALEFAARSLGATAPHAQLSGLTALALGDCTEVSDLAAVLRRAPALEHLDVHGIMFSGTRAWAECTAALAACRRLRKLHLGVQEATHSMLQVLPQTLGALARLQQLHVELGPYWHPGSSAAGPADNSADTSHATASGGGGTDALWHTALRSCVAQGLLGLAEHCQALVALHAVDVGMCFELNCTDIVPLTLVARVVQAFAECASLRDLSLRGMMPDSSAQEQRMVCDTAAPRVRVLLDAHA